MPVSGSGPFREIVEETIQLGLSAQPSSPRKAVTIETHRVGIKPAYQGLSMNQLYDQIESEGAGGAMIVPDANIFDLRPRPSVPEPNSRARSWWEGALSRAEPVGLPWVVGVGRHPPAHASGHLRKVRYHPRRSGTLSKAGWAFRMSGLSTCPSKR